MDRHPCYPFKSEAAKAEYEAYCLQRFKQWPVGSETRLLDTPTGQTYVRACGRTTDPPLVLLMGARGSSLSWTEMIPTLSANHRVYALDTIIDAGFSVPNIAITKPEDLVQWLDEVHTALVPDGPINLMGISYGGFISAQYALRRPERVRRVVLLAPGNTVQPLSKGFAFRMATLAVPLPSRRATFRRMLRWIFADAARGSDAVRASFEQALADLEISIRLMTLPRPPMPTVIDDAGWQGFRPPCLFMVGENEKIYSARKAVERLNRIAPHVKTEIIPGAGHDLTIVHPDLVMSKALEFLRGQAQAAA